MKQVHDQKGTGPPAREGKPEGDMRLLAVAINRALQRRLGDIPSPADVHKVVNKLTNDGAKPSAFVRHATRVQEELARLHARIQFERDQERQDHAIASIQDPPIMSSIRPRKRSAGHDDDDDSTYLAQEAKRVRLDNTGPARLHPHAPLPTSDNKPKPPAESIPPKGMPIASRDPRVAEPRVDPVRPQASLDDSPSALPLMATEPPLSNNTISDPDSKTGQCSPSDNADGESRKNTKSLVERSDRPVPVDPSSAQTHSLVANVPGIWAIQVGKPSAGQTDVTFVVDQETASSVRRWATHRQGLNPDARHVVVHLVVLQTTAVSAVQRSLSQSPGGMTPQAFALALRDLQPQWPDDGSFVLQLNTGQPGERTWFLSDILDGMPLDVSGAICEGTNSLRIMQLKNMADIVFAMYAALPTPESLAAALEWERSRNLYSFRRRPLGPLLG